MTAGLRDLASGGEVAGAAGSRECENAPGAAHLRGGVLGHQPAGDPTAGLDLDYRTEPQRLCLPKKLAGASVRPCPADVAADEGGPHHGGMATRQRAS